MSQPKTVFILSLSSDIGEHLALDFLRRGASVLGTYRRELPPSLRGRSEVRAICCDVSRSSAGAEIGRFLREANQPWDVFVSCVGQLAPVGPFFDCEFETWAESLNVNSVAQLRALHAAYRYRRLNDLCHVVFFAGGGSNGPMPRYSAYCAGKITLTKMCELLDDENGDLNVFIVGTGWVRTKIHQQTIAAGDKAGANHARTMQFMTSSDGGTTHAEIAEMIRWGMAQGRTAAGGRNFSVVHDQWRDQRSELAAALVADRNKFKLRRQGNT